MSFKKIDMDETKPSGKKGVILYGFNEDEIEKLQEICEEYDVEAIYQVDKSQAGLKIGDILKGNTEVKEYKGAVAKRSIIMSAFSNKELQEFIEAIKKESLSKPIFAVVTPTSATWELGRLVKELMMESMMMQQQRRKKH